MSSNIRFAFLPNKIISSIKGVYHYLGLCLIATAAYEDAVDILEIEVRVFGRRAPGPRLSNMGELDGRQHAAEHDRQHGRRRARPAAPG